MSCFKAQTSAQTSGESDPSKHVNFTLGMVLGVDDFTQEFAYLSARDRWAARDLVGYGTARGLKVRADEDSKGPRVVVEPGVAVTPSGQLVCVEAAQCCYINQWLAGRGADVLDRMGAGDSLRLYVVLCYRDCPTDSVAIPGEACRDESELTAPSRLKDDFLLELRFDRPKQTEEEAVRAFVAWLAAVGVSDGAASTPLEDFLAELKAAALDWLAPASPPAELPVAFDSPPSFLNINPSDLSAYLAAAFRTWVTELRPRWVEHWRGCAPSPFAAPAWGEDDCVLLAELDVPLLQSPPDFVASDTEDVTVNEETRPFIVHLRALQEWLLAGRAGTGGAPADASFILKRSSANLPGAQSLGDLPTGLLLNTAAAGEGTLSSAVEGTHYYRPGGVDVRVADGGTGLSTAPANGQLLIGSGGNYALANLQGANGLTVANGAGTVTLGLPQPLAAVSSPAFAGLTVGGTLSAAGAFRVALRNVATGNWALNATDHVIVCDTTAGNVSIVLPSITAQLHGRVFVIKRASGGANACTVAATAPDPIDGAAGPVNLAAQNRFVVLIANFIANNNKAWHIIGTN